MTFVPAHLLLNAVQRLEGAHPLAVVTLPALLRVAATAGVDPTATPVPFGSSDEARLLDDYFSLPRPPEDDRPYRAIWSGSVEWQKRKYPGGGLQRMRRDQAGKGRVFVQVKQQGEQDRWGMTPSAGAELAATCEQDDLTCPVSLVDLAIWFGRDVDISSLPDSVTQDVPDGAPDIARLVAWFSQEFAPNRGDLVGTVYDGAVPDDYRNVTFADSYVDEATYEALGSLPPAPSFRGSMDELVTVLEGYMERHGFAVPAGQVHRVVRAWLNGDIVLLIGQPGTGKSTFANLLAGAFQEHFGTDQPVTVTIRSDFDEAEFLGYERLDGTAQLREFSETVLKSEEPLAAHIVVLEEVNLASMENYLASVLVATQDIERAVLLPSGERVQLPIDTFIIGTCNSYRDEPETRMRVSAPTKRRSSIITMPNVLADRYEEGGVDAVLDLAIQMVKTEGARIADRVNSNRASQFDLLRHSALSTVRTTADLSQEVRATLSDICRSLLDTPIGASWFTAGLLRDVALTVARAERGAEAELTALGDAVASKIVHQLRGSHSDIQDFRAAVAELPNAAEIDALTDRMMAGPSDDLIPLL